MSGGREGLRSVGKLTQDTPQTLRQSDRMEEAMKRKISKKGALSGKLCAWLCALLLLLTAEADAYAESGAWETPIPIPTPTFVPDIPVSAGEFPDPAFRALIETSCDTDGDGMLSQGEIRQTVSLLCPAGQITSLEGIGHFTGLETLDCRDNLLTELDLTGNTKLRSLNISSNQLTGIDLGANTMLESLVCSGNSLSGLDLRTNTALVSVNADSNELTSLELTGLAALSRLQVRNNSLTELDLSGCEQLKEVIRSGVFSAENGTVLFQQSGGDASAAPALFCDEAVCLVNAGPVLAVRGSSEYETGSGGTLSFYCSGRIGGVSADNVTLTDPADFSVSGNGKTVTLYPAFLNRLRAGEDHALSVQTTDGTAAWAAFSVLGAPAGGADVDGTIELVSIDDVDAHTFTYTAELRICHETNVPF